MRLPRGSFDAALAPYHVDRSKLFVLSRIEAFESFDAERIARAIEWTRFPSSTQSNHREPDDLGALLWAADMIGQLGEPHYLRKVNALYHEFEEIGINKQFGYATPADMIDLYPKFYWNSISPYLRPALR